MKLPCPQGGASYLQGVTPPETPRFLQGRKFIIGNGYLFRTKICLYTEGNPFCKRGFPQSPFPKTFSLKFFGKGAGENTFLPEKGDSPKGFPHNNFVACFRGLHHMTGLVNKAILPGPHQIPSQHLLHIFLYRTPLLPSVFQPHPYGLWIPCPL